MKTTIYELLGMIKDNNTPKKILFKGSIFEYANLQQDYYSQDAKEWLFDEYVLLDVLNDEVEILETTITYNQDNIENNKQDKIEKINVLSYDRCIYGVTHKEKELALEIRHTQIKINEIIDRIN